MRLSGCGMGGCQRSALPCPFGLAGVENFRRLCGSEPCPEACHTAYGEGRPPLQVGTGVPSVGLGGFVLCGGRSAVGPAESQRSPGPVAALPAWARPRWGGRAAATVRFPHQAVLFRRNILDACSGYSLMNFRSSAALTMTLF